MKSYKDYLEEECAYTEHFKNKEFFPNLKDEDLLELFVYETTWDKPFKNEGMCWNFLHLNECARDLRSFLDTPMVITSGFRSMRKHLEIYKNKNIPSDKIPMSSRHLTLEAFDFRTKDLDLAKNKIKMLYGKGGQIDKTFLKIIFPNRTEEELKEKIEKYDRYYFEDFDHTPSWIHVQMVAPRSKSRFFIP